MSNASFYSKLNKDQKYILICCFCFAVNGLYAMILGSLLPLISNEYNLNNTVSGGLISAHQAGNLIAGFIAGILPVYLGRKKQLFSYVVLSSWVFHYDDYRKSGSASFRLFIYRTKSWKYFKF